MQVNAIKRRKASYSIVEQVIGMIGNGTLKPGDRLPPERQFALDFDVSRATLREALSVMEFIGVIEMRVGEGTYVTDMNIVPFFQIISQLFVRDTHMENELLDLRKLLETEAVRLTLKRDVPAAEMDMLRKVVDKMERCFFTGDVEGSAEADWQFHQTLFFLSDNFILQKVGECIALIMESSVRFNRNKLLQDTNNMEVLFNQHYNLYRALLQRDEAMAFRMINKHLDQVKQMI